MIQEKTVGPGVENPFWIGAVQKGEEEQHITPICITTFFTVTLALYSP